MDKNGSGTQHLKPFAGTFLSDLVSLDFVISEICEFTQISGQSGRLGFNIYPNQDYIKNIYSDCRLYKFSQSSYTLFKHFQWTNG